MPATADKFSRLAALKPARSTAAPAERSALRAPGDEDVLGQLLGAAVARNHFGEHLTLRNWFSTPESIEPSPVSLELLSRTRDESLSRKTRTALDDPSKWLFLDTETTGLAGGTGTYAFLIGLAWWDAGGLQIEQFLMRDFTEEFSLLQELAERIKERPVLLTFNGKSFDWPLLENRFTMTRSIATPKLAAHLDLLHPARALWKLRLGSVRLAELERCVLDARRLGWHRGGDMESALIPQYYFDYLRGGSAQPIVGIVRHNQLDLRGLAALFCKINAMLSESAGVPDECEGLDLFGLSRFLQRRGDASRAHNACARALAIGLPADIRPKAQRELALMAKRRGEHERAAEIWEKMVANSQDEVQACEQLAIYYEHRVKDSRRAIEYATLGLAKLRRERACSLRGSSDPYLAVRFARQEKAFNARLSRLERKALPSSPARLPDVPEPAEPKAIPKLW
ncbi:MAG TPA: ribonuclease H-like domain-containing protein [Candidatus Acidoferrum sp.]|nr:ribonuclease H-like domain-containing protein [Candidatus Acidoferrum sp.]